MKILWLCNVTLPKIARHLNRPVPNVGGWLTGISDSLTSKKEVTLHVCFPTNDMGYVEGNVDNITFYSFNKKDVLKYDESSVEQLSKIINKVNPDIVHIFGTEYPHALEMIQAFNCPQRTVISIQGLVSVYSKHFFSNLPLNVINRYSFRDLLKLDNIIRQKKKYERRGVYEIRAIKSANNIIGRTDWDKACMHTINKNAEYFHCNESLRSEFYKYSGTWSADSCQKYSIFVSQANYPIKGIHNVIEALKIVIMSFPQAHLYIAGHNITNKKTLKDKLRISSYGKYINELIDKNELNRNITFTGELTEQEMCQRYLKSNIFVSASSIENSPNSVGEAMLLGVPTISTDVGGVKNMFRHEEDGFIYQADAPYMLAFYICKVFEDDNLAKFFSHNSFLHAQKTHDCKTNSDQLMHIYNSILKKRKY